jgi:hypothetical protein
MKMRISQSHEIFVKNIQNWHAAISIYIVLVEESHTIDPKVKEHGAIFWLQCKQMHCDMANNADARIKTWCQ